MANFIQYDPSTGEVFNYLGSVNTPDYLNKPGYMVWKDPLPTTNLRWLYVENGEVKVKTTDPDLAIKEEQAINTALRQNLGPIQDQIITILKQLNYMQMNKETNLITEMDALVQSWLSVERQTATIEADTVTEAAAETIIDTTP